MNKNDILQLFKIFEESAISHLSNASKSFCSCWETALRLLKDAKNFGFTKAELEDMEKIKERLYRIYSVSTELYVAYSKINNKDKFEVVFPQGEIKR